MIQELNKIELQNINGGEVTPESAGEACGMWFGKALMAYASLKGVFKLKKIF